VVDASEAAAGYILYDLFGILGSPFFEGWKKGKEKEEVLNLFIKIL